MTWRVALIDSCGSWPGALDAAAFVSVGGRVERREPGADGSGHGSRIARLLGEGGAEHELMLGQVFLGAEPATSAAVAAAIDWAAAGGAELFHLSLGLAADRPVLAEAVERAVRAGCLIVAATPARGATVYPAAYAGVVRASGDARCAPGEVSYLGPGLFGGCPRFAADDDARGGASVGAAWITRKILSGPKYAAAGAVAAALMAAAVYVGPERRE
jgi:hypothetical protein